MTPAQHITHSLRGQWHGTYGSARCPAHDDHSPSLSIADGNGGRLLLKCHRGCDYEAIRSALDLPRPQVNRDLGSEKQSSVHEHNAKRSEQARRLWNETRPLSGSLAERYLRGRGISCDLPSASLAYHPACWHLSARRLPALVARVTGGTDFAVHRTYLAPDGSGKAQLTPAKAMLGQTKGGAVRLTEGSGLLVVAEGLETALSLLCGLLPYRAPSVWAPLGASGLAGLRLPHRAGSLVIASDGDPAGRQAAEQLALRADALGWRITLMPAPEGCDWNDVLRHREADQ